LAQARGKEGRDQDYDPQEFLSPSIIASNQCARGLPAFFSPPHHVKKYCFTLFMNCSRRSGAGRFMA
jgi:hypothetical protein